MNLTELSPGGVRPILLTGIPRSGTTWAGRMLTVGTEAGYINEPFNLARSPGSLRVPLEHWYAYVTDENEERFLPALAPMLRFEYPLARELKLCRNRTDLHHTLKTWREFVRSRGLRPLVKEPHAVFSADWFMRRLGSDVVVMVRDPLAVVSSWKRLDWEFDFTDLLKQPALMRDWLGPFEREMSAAVSESWGLVECVALFWRVVYSVVADARYPRVHVVRHEDLSRDPLGQYARLYGALGLDFSDSVARAVAGSSSGRNPTETTIAKPHDTAIDSRANLENWRHRLSEAEIESIWRVAGATAALYYPELTWA